MWKVYMGRATAININFDTIKKKEIKTNLVSILQKMLNFCIRKKIMLIANTKYFF